MTPTEDVARIAAGLTKAQEAALALARDMPAIVYGVDTWEVNAGGATVALVKKRLIRECEFRSFTGRSRRGYRLTPLGLAVRNHLIERARS